MLCKHLWGLAVLSSEELNGSSLKSDRGDKTQPVRDLAGFSIQARTFMQQKRIKLQRRRQRPQESLHHSAGWEAQKTKPKEFTFLRRR